MVGPVHPVPPHWPYCVWPGSLTVVVVTGGVLVGGTLVGGVVVGGVVVGGGAVPPEPGIGPAILVVIDPDSMKTPLQ